MAVSELGGPRAKLFRFRPLRFIPRLLCSPMAARNILPSPMWLDQSRRAVHCFECGGLRLGSLNFIAELFGNALMIISLCLVLAGLIAGLLRLRNSGCILGLCCRKLF